MSDIATESDEPEDERIRVLIGDDDCDFAEAMSDFLDRKGFNASFVDSTDDLFRVTVEENPDVVVSDYDYGVRSSAALRDGVAVGLALRVSGVQVPFIIHSGLDRPEAIEAGFSCCSKGNFEHLISEINSQAGEQ